MEMRWGLFLGFPLMQVLCCFVDWVKVENFHIYLSMFYQEPHLLRIPLMKCLHYPLLAMELNILQFLDENVWV